MWGSPIEHSLSPVLHRAAFAALGLRDWTYQRREVTAAGFRAAFDGLDATWRGLSLTMPLKEVALAVADRATDRACDTGAANTLIRGAAGWSADNTDVHGILAALREVGCRRAGRVAIVGSGATARSAVAAAARLGASEVILLVRNGARPETVAQARGAGLRVDVAPIGHWPVVDLIVNTVPPSALVGLPEPPVGRETTVLDVVYGSGTTPLVRLARARGWPVAEGTSMLLHQAGEQVRLMTGHAAPLESMRAALAEALDARSGAQGRS